MTNSLELLSCAFLLSIGEVVLIYKRWTTANTNMLMGRSTSFPQNLSSPQRPLPSPVPGRNQTQELKTIEPLCHVFSVKRIK